MASSTDWNALTTMQPIDVIRLTAKELFAKCQNTFERTQAVDIVIEMMLNRMLSGAESLDTLTLHAVHNHRLDSYCIARVIYDLHFQFLYLLQRPSERAEDYIRFSIIEVQQIMEIAKSSSTALARKFDTNAAWKTVAPHLQMAYDQNSPLFAIKNKSKPKPRDHWYDKSNLAEIAVELKMEREYRLYHKVLAGVVHSSAPNLYTDFVLALPPIEIGWRSAMRCIGATAKVKNVEMDHVEAEAYKIAFNHFD